LRRPPRRLAVSRRKAPSIASETADGDLLADGNGRVRNHVFDGLGLVVNELLLHQLVEVSRVRQRDVLRNGVREILEVVGLAKEAEIQRAKAIESGKPEKIVDRIVAGQIEKYYKEVCLLDQQFVKDGDKTITSLMNETAKAAGTTLDIVRYVRFERGEGIEKRKDDLAAEIAAMKKA